MDVSIRSLEIANDRLRMDDLPPRQRERIRLLHGSLMYRDKRLSGFDAAAIVEVVEHLIRRDWPPSSGSSSSSPVQRRSC